MAQRGHFLAESCKKHLYVTLVLKSKLPHSSSGKTLVAEKLRRSLWFALASSSVSLALLTPLFVSASTFSLSALLSSIIRQTSAAGTTHNSQTLPVLSPATNIDPRAASGGGDITLVGGTALLSEDGPSGTAADVETALPEATTISVYTVHEGDTLGEIAEMFGVTVNTIVWANDLKGKVIKPGQELVILPVTGVRYTVKSGDTLASVAKKYKADANEIAQYNNVATLTPGETIIIPDGEVAVAAPVRATATQSGATSPLRGAGGSALSGYFTWPVSGGVLTQGLHGYNGVDIGAPTGTNILASAGGVVIVANGGGGWNGGYGNYIVIQHDNGTQTLYAHASKVYVSSGQRVAQGALIGAVGRSGKATGPHLHFEIRGAANPFGR